MCGVSIHYIVNTAVECFNRRQVTPKIKLIIIIKSAPNVMLRYTICTETKITLLNKEQQKFNVWKNYYISCPKTVLLLLKEFSAVWTVCSVKHWWLVGPAADLFLGVINSLLTGLFCAATYCDMCMVLFVSWEGNTIAWVVSRLKSAVGPRLQVWSNN